MKRKPKCRVMVLPYGFATCRYRPKVAHQAGLFGSAKFDRCLMPSGWGGHQAASPQKRHRSLLLLRLGSCMSILCLLHLRPIQSHTRAVILILIKKPFLHRSPPNTRSPSHAVGPVIIFAGARAFSASAARSAAAGAACASCASSLSLSVSLRHLT